MGHYITFTVNEFCVVGMVMLPMGDACSILGQTDGMEHKMAQVQIVSINGQPTLQLVGDPSMLQTQFTNTGTGKLEAFVINIVD